MKRFLLVWAVSLLIASGARAEVSTPSTTISVNTIAATAEPIDGYTRLRLNLTRSDSKSETVPLASVAVCSASACYEAAVPSGVVVSTTAKGLSTSIADFEIPYAEITSVRFQARGRKGALQGSVALQTPLKLDPDFRRGDVLVVVEKSGGSYRPTSAGATYYHPQRTSVYYNPALDTVAALPLGVVLSIPAGALDAAQVFSVGVHDTWDDFPEVDIFPSLNFAKPAKVSLPVLDQEAQALQSGTPRSPTLDWTESSGLTDVRSTGAKKTGPATVEIRRTGTVRNERPSLGSELNSGSPLAPIAARMCLPGSTGCNCANEISLPDAQLAINNALAATGTTHVKNCTTIAPYVHIVISNLADSRVRFTIKHSPKVARPSGKYKVMSLPLQQLTTWSQNTRVMINGFTWEVDEGTGPNQFGLANGFVSGYKPSELLGVNRGGGASCEDFIGYTDCVSASVPDGKKRVIQVSKDGFDILWSDREGLGLLGGVGSYVSSSTSIVRNSVCSTDTLNNRWSAVGTTSARRMIFISSTSEGTTTAAALCPVFQALGVSNAIRLDGGPSAALTLDGKLMNPLKGLYSLKYGDARYIPYGLKIAGEEQ